MVGVDEVEGFVVELNTAGGAGEGDPEFSVEEVEVGDVGAGVEADLVEAAGAEEAPGVTAGGGGRSGVGHEGSLYG